MPRARDLFCITKYLLEEYIHYDNFIAISPSSYSLDSVPIDQTLTDDHRPSSDNRHSAMITWILVFWLELPTNYTEYTEYKTERECRDAAQLWQRRFDLVKSRLVAECRERKL